MENQQLYNELINFNPLNAKKFIFEGLITIAKVYKVYDGDTISIIFKYNNEFIRDSCRIAGIDTPELSRCSDEEKQMGYIARDYLKTLILDKVIKVQFIKPDKYGRPLINIFLLDEQQTNINNLMITGGYAVKYNGKGPKSDWV